MAIWIACYDCGEYTAIEESKYLSSRVICADCLADRREKLGLDERVGS